MDVYTGEMYSFCDNDNGDNLLFFNYEEWSKDPKKFSNIFFQDVKKIFNSEKDVEMDDDSKCELYGVYICEDTKSFHEEEEKGAVYIRDYSFYSLAEFLEKIANEEAIIKSADVMRKIIKEYIEECEPLFRIFNNLERLSRAMKIKDNFTEYDKDYRGNVGYEMIMEFTSYEEDVIKKLKNDKY
jgi:hypothetical protein